MMASFLGLAASYRSFDQNPKQYMSATTFGKAALDRLERSKDQLFTKEHRKYKIPVRDISAAGRVEKINLFSEEELKSFLGDASTNEIEGASSYKPDAKCRFVHLCAPRTIGPLELNETMLLRLMTFYQIMPQFSDFLLVYASQHGRDRELRFSGFRTDKVLANPIKGTIIPQLGRSGRRYQICFNLKTVALKKYGEWKIRQAVLHHQLDLGQGTQLWIIGDPHATLKDRIAGLFSDRNTYPTSFSTVQEGFKSSLEVHLDFAQWATSEWRWHILYLEGKAEEFTKPARIREKVHIEKLEPESLSDVQNWEERTNDAIMAMESNVNILKLQKKFYRDLVKDNDFPRPEKQGCMRAVASFDSQLEELICETQMQIIRAKLLVKMISDRKTILIQHFQTQNAIVSSKLTVTMYEQADRSAVEAIAVRIVTIVTLIYLPATFSSTFFSTDIIKYQEGEKFSMIALERFLQVTLPLMFLTFVSAGLWFWIEWRRRARDFRKIRNRLPDVFEPELVN